MFAVPKGYLCLFTQPFNRNAKKNAFCISGVVRSDGYYNTVNIPLAICLKHKKDSITFKKVDPLVQIIPFLRKNKIKLKYEIVDRGTLTEVIDGVKTNKNFYTDQVKTQ